MENSQWHWSICDSVSGCKAEETVNQWSLRWSVDHTQHRSLKRMIYDSDSPENRCHVVVNHSTVRLTRGSLIWSAGFCNWFTSCVNGPFSITCGSGVCWIVSAQTSLCLSYFYFFLITLKMKRTAGSLHHWTVTVSISAVRHCFTTRISLTLTGDVVFRLRLNGWTVRTITWRHSS